MSGPPVATIGAAPLASSPRIRRKVIIDTDGGCDDAVAIVLALRDPNVEVLALTSVFGNVAIEQATENIYTILRVFDRLSIPFYAGCGVPLLAAAGPIHTWPGHGGNGLGDALFHEDAASAAAHDHEVYRSRVAKACGSQHASLALLEFAKMYPHEIDLIALGPLTNLALATRFDPAFPTLIRSLTIMGGSAWSKGNASLCAEFNWFVDPESAAIVLSSFPAAAAAPSTPSAASASTSASTSSASSKGCEVLIIPWETTESCGLNWAQFDELTQGHEVHVAQETTLERRLHTLEASFLKKTHAKYELLCREDLFTPMMVGAKEKEKEKEHEITESEGGKILTDDQVDALNAMPSLPELQSAAIAAAAAVAAVASSTSAASVATATAASSPSTTATAAATPEFTLPSTFVSCDAYAVACLLRPELIAASVNHYAEVITQGSSDIRGMMAIDWYDRRRPKQGSAAEGTMSSHRTVRIVTQIHKQGFIGIMRDTFQPTAATRAAMAAATAAATEAAAASSSSSALAKSQ